MPDEIKSRLPRMPQSPSERRLVYHCPQCGAVQRRSELIRDPFCPCGCCMFHTELSPQEIKILRAYAAGLNTKEIAEQFCVSTKTVDSHRANTFLKSGFKTVGGAVAWGIKQKIILI